MRLVVALGVAVIALMTRTAHADGIVLEAYTGERPADAPRLLAPILEELAQKKFSAGDGVARLFEARVSRAAVQIRGVPEDFAAQVDRGFKAWVSGRFDEAISQLGQLVATAHANTGRFAVEPGLREPLQKALIALALAQQRVGDEAAMRATFGELLRSYPDVQVTRAAYGPDAQGAFEQVRRDLATAGRGKLMVNVNDDSAVVFINEAYRAAGSMTTDLAPGDYRVIAMLSKQPSRAHRVSVTANGSATVEIDAKWDHTVRTVGFTGLLYASPAEREANEAPHAARFARAVGASAVVVVGIDEVRGRSAVVGSLVSLQTGRELRRASIPVEPDPSSDRLRSLARFLAGEEPAPGLDVQFSEPRDAPALPDKPRWGGWRWITATVALAGLVTGGALVGFDGRCSNEPPAGQPCNDLYATATPGFIALGGGALFAGISIYLFATTRGTGPVVAPTAGGATVGFATRW